VEAESLNYSKQLLKSSGLSTRLITRCELGKWREKEPLTFNFLKDIVSSNDVGENWLFIYGGTGTGKTYAAVIAAQIAIMKEKSVYFTGVPKLLDDLRPNADEEIRHVTLQKCYKADVLILDDIGHEKSSQWVRERLYLIINERWNSGKITIFTSNFPVENLKESVSEAVYSRVRGDSLVVNLEGNDKRMSLN